MTYPANPENETPAGPTTTGMRIWLDPHRKRFWAIALLILYTLAGFFLVPLLVKSTLVGTLQEDLGRQASIERVRFNPYVLSLEINGFAMLDPDGATLAGFDRFFVNFQLSSLFRWAWTFREVSLEGLDLRFERFAPGDSRLTRLLADQAARAEPRQPEDGDDGRLPRLLIQELNLREGHLRFRDDVPADTVDLDFGPVDISVEALNTLPDRNGQQDVSVQLPLGALARWQGSIDLAPLQSEGTFTLENSHLDRTIAYLKAVLPLESMQAILSLSTHYEIRERPDGSISVGLDSLEAELADFAVSGLAPASEFIAFPFLQLSGGRLSYPENTLDISSIRLSEPRLAVWLDENGIPSLNQLLPTTTGQSTDPSTEPSAAEDWHLAVGEFSVVGGRIALADRSIEPEAALDVEDINLVVRDISNENAAQFPTNLTANLAGGGSFGFDGQITALPGTAAKGTVTASEIPLGLAQPYVQNQVNVLIKKGALNATADLTLNPDGNLLANGGMAITGLRVDDTVEDKPLVGWERFEIDRFEADTNTSALGLSLLTLEQPFGRLVIRPDRTTNLSGLVPEADPETAAGDGDAEGATPFAIVVGGIVVRDGALDFSDFSLPLPFATQIRQLAGTISTVDTNSASPSDIRLEGQVDDYGLARIDGAMDLLDPVSKTDVTMEFRNLLMSNLSPYTIQFAGREIDEGKLDLDLTYRIDGGQLIGQNDIVMSDLVLGDEVDSPDAVSLPLGLAVALLTDANGVIDIDLPVEGDINDPEFAIGGVIWQAFVGLVTKVVTAPFRLLGSLIGIESEDLGQFQFLAGRTDLTPPELEKVEQLRQALQQRPELAIEVAGVFDPAVDVPALQFLRLRSEIIERIGEGYAQPGEELRMLSEEIRGGLEALFVERNPDVPLDSVKAVHLAPPADDPEGKPRLDDLAYATDLRDRLLAAEEIGQQDLDELANSRAEAVRTAFLASGKFDENRIVLVAPKASESDDGEWVVMELGVVAE
jgi:hypothetical protein